MRRQINGAIATNRQLINYISSNHVFIYYCSIYRDYNDQTLSALIFENFEFIENMKKVQDNPYIIKIHLNIALKLRRANKGGARGEKRVLQKSKSGDWLDIFYDPSSRSPTTSPFSTKKMDLFSSDVKIKINMPSNTPCFIFDKNNNIFYNIFCCIF